jgi:hypothetical protein
MKKYFLVLGLIVTSYVNAGTSTSLSEPSNASPWHYGLGMGLTEYSDMDKNEGKTALGRFYISRELRKESGFGFGVELGFQTGNGSKLKLSAAQYFDLGNVAVQAHNKPMIDILLTASKTINENTSVFIKGGVAYRQITFDRDTISSLEKIDPEVQVGLAMKLSNNTSLSLSYQNIIGGDAEFTTTNPSTTLGSGTGHIKNIPTQHGILITLTMRTN